MEQFGNFQDVEQVKQAKIQRNSFGRFFYRFPNGESGLDVYNRVTSFMATLNRDMQMLKQNDIDVRDLDVVIITHGLTLRLFLMRWFQFTVDDFEITKNPANAQPVIMERCENEAGAQWYELQDSSLQMLNLPRPRWNRLRAWSDGQARGEHTV
jgi:broad specificity phosphatase PhoE